MKKIDFWNSYKGEKNPHMERTFLKYDRFHEANGIRDHLGKEVDENFTVLDYGCGVGDYGLTFARLGALAAFYDFAEFIDFARYRLMREGLEKKGIFLNAATGKAIPKPYDLVIFGEVLEHLDNPLEILTSFADAGAKYLFTSSYPYRRDDDEEYWNHGGHDGAAREQQPACRELLETRYTKVANFGGELNLWKSRNA